MRVRELLSPGLLLLAFSTAPVSAQTTLGSPLTATATAALIYDVIPVKER